MKTLVAVQRSLFLYNNRGNFMTFRCNFLIFAVKCIPSLQGDKRKMTYEKTAFSQPHSSFYVEKRTFYVEKCTFYVEKCTFYDKK